MQGLLVLADVGEVRVAGPDQRPPEQLEGGLVRVEELRAVVVIDLVHVDCDQGEADVDDHEDEEEHEHVDDHVRHGDDDGASLSPHQSSLQKEGMKLLPMK